MKTREINCTVGCEKSKVLNSNNIIVMFSEKEIEDFTSDNDYLYKAKLIIEIPEKKIEITESQLDESLHIIKLVEAKTEKQMKALITVIKKELGFTDE